MTQSEELIALGWRLYLAKVTGGLLEPDNEKMMQLHLAQTFQTLAPLYEHRVGESYKVLLEVPVTLPHANRIIDIVLQHSFEGVVSNTAIELKCFRRYVRGSGGLRKRGAQNLGMYDYWEDIENIEGYSTLPDYEAGHQLTITDAPTMWNPPTPASRLPCTPPVGGGLPLPAPFPSRLPTGLVPSP